MNLAKQPSDRSEISELGICRGFLVPGALRSITKTVVSKKGSFPSVIEDEQVSKSCIAVRLDMKRRAQIGARTNNVSRGTMIKKRGK